MATKIWRGTAKAKPQVDWVTPSDPNPGDTFTLTCNRKDIEVTAATDTSVAGELIADVIAKMVSAVGQYSNTEPEFAEVSASAGTDDAGDTTHLILTGPTTGKPVTLSASATASDFEVLVQELRRGVPARTAKQYLVPRGTYTGGTFDLDYDGATISTVAYNASASTLQTAINTGKAAESPSVTVSGDAGGPYLIETDYAVPVIEVDGSSLTGGDFVEVIQGRDGLAAGLSLVVSRDGTGDAQFRLLLGPNPGSLDRTAWISHDATADEVAYALLGAGYYAAVRPTTAGVWDIELISDLNGATSSDVQASIESTDDSYTVTGTTRTAVNEVQYLRINATSGNLQIDASTVAVDGADFFSADTVAGSLAKLIKDTTGLDNTVSKVGTGPTNTQNLVKIEFENGAEVSPLQISDASLAGGCYDVAVLEMGSAGLDEIQQVAFSRTPTGGTFTLTYEGNTSSAIAYNATAGALETGLESITGISAGDVSVEGPAGGPWVVTFTGNLEASELSLLSGSGASLTGGNTPGFTLANQQSPESPNHWDVADNWYNPAAPSTPSKPAASDDVVFRNNTVDCLYGLEDLSSSTLSSLTVEASFTGNLGLPEYTGDYYEYRPQRLKCGITTLTIGEGSGAGSARLNFNLEAAASTVTVYKTGTSGDSSPAVQVTGTSTSNAYRILGGSVGIGTGAENDTPAGSSLTIGAGPNSQVRADVTVTGGTITTVEQIGGTSALKCSATTFNHRAGQTTIDGAPTFATFLCSSRATVRSTGTITDAIVISGGVFDLSSNAAGLTITNLYVYTGGNFNDPWGKATLTNGVDLVYCSLADVTIDTGNNKSISLGTASPPSP